MLVLVVALLGACSEDTKPNEQCAISGDAPMCGQPCTNPCGCACHQIGGTWCAGDQIMACSTHELAREKKQQ